MAEPLCARCGRGGKVLASYTFGGVEHDASYCGWCGGTWSTPAAAVPTSPSAPSASGEAKRGGRMAPLKGLAERFTAKLAAGKDE